MKILAFDTALGACSAALVFEGEVIAQRFKAQARGHAETVMDLVAEICREAGVKIPDLDRIGVTIGPGTFTGQRVGLAAARAMVLGTELSLIGVTTLEALAAACAHKTKAQANPIASVIDARRGEVYVQVFSPALAPLDTPKIMTPDEAAFYVKDIVDPRPVWLVGTGGPLMKPFYQGEMQVFEGGEQPDAIYVAECAAKAPEPKLGEAPPSPLYLRAPDAKLPS